MKTSADENTEADRQMLRTDIAGNEPVEQEKWAEPTSDLRIFQNRTSLRQLATIIADCGAEGNLGILGGASQILGQALSESRIVSSSFL